MITLKKGNKVNFSRTPDGPISLFCEVIKVRENKIKFYVKNGDWDGTFNQEKNEIYIHYTKARIPAFIVEYGKDAEDYGNEY